MRARLLAIGALGLATTAANVLAQRVSGPTARPFPLFPADSTRTGDRGDDLEAPSVVVSAATPRSFRVLAVPPPAEFAASNLASFEVVAADGMVLLGASRGTIVNGGSIVLTVRVPASAGAGRLRAGFVRFAAPGRQAVRVPIDVEVARVGRVQVTAAQPMLGAHPGDRVVVTFSILNAGNLPDTVDLDVEAPDAWSPRLVGSPRLILQRGEAVERSIAATIPLTTDLGDVAITLVARNRSGERSGASSIVEVADPARGPRRPGPVVTVGAASASSGGVGTRTVESVAIEGPLTDAVTIAGRLSTPASNDLVEGRALATLGYNSQANFLTLASPAWGTTIGTTGVTLDDLAGQNVFGRGAYLRLGLPDERVQLLAASPFSAPGSIQPALLAVTAQRETELGMVTAFLSHLRDSTYVVRSVDALGASLEVQPWQNATASAAVADRSYRDGNGLGAEADFRGPVAGGDVSLRLTHAPGGSSAFAPARDLLSLAADRTLGRLNTSMSVWSTRDNDATQSAISSTGWSLSPTYAILPTLTVGVDVTHSSVASRDSTAGFGSSQTDYGVRARWLNAGFEISADSRLSTVGQSVIDSAISVQDGSARRVINRLSVDRIGPHGAIGVGGSVETAALGGTITAPQSTFDAHVERFEFWPRFPRWTISATAQRLRFGDVATTTSRVELDVGVKASLRIVLGAEHGTVRDAFGGLHTVFTFKVERASSVAAFDRRVVTGVVFQDRNANGVRDPGEPGVPGVVVHRGSETAVTDANGEYRMTSGSTARAELDDRSLPRGWLQSPRLLDRTTDVLDLGVIPITALDVRIDVAPLGDGSVPAVRVGAATFTLRDTTGREWIARADASQRAVFDALPAGRYTITAELDGSSEPLVVDPTPPIDVGGTPGRQHVVVTVRTRPVRIFKTKQQTEGRGGVP